MPDSLTLSLWIGMAAAVAGAMLGAYQLLQGRAGAGDRALAGTLAAESRASGGMLLASHALTAALLLQAPKIGACCAAALAAGWLGGSAGRIAARLRDGAPLAYPRLVAEALLCLALALPLWTYVRIIRIHAGL